MLDPYANLVYDYMGGLEDIKKAKVRTTIRASHSFLEDCARILRAIRIVARLGFRFTRETAYSIKNLSCSVLRLDKGRILMEMNYMLAYGSAEASLRQRILFNKVFRRRDKRSNMLLHKLFKLQCMIIINGSIYYIIQLGPCFYYQGFNDYVPYSHDFLAKNGPDASDSISPWVKPEDNTEKKIPDQHVRSASGIESGAPSGLVPARLPTFHASTQGSWHAVIAYDAYVRLCLHAWAKQCMEAPMFLENECALLRDTFRYFLSNSLLLVECGRVKIMTNFCFCNLRKNHDENF
ncbi:hypothetical protein ACSBR1_043565 [Camellia fascicularis]